MFMFIWQVPHFWLLLLVVGDEYQRAGLPTLGQVFSPQQVRHVTFMWVLAAATAGLILPAVPASAVGLPWNLIMVIAAVSLGLKAIAVLWPAPAEAAVFRRVFIQVNTFALLMVLCLAANAVAPRW
jgi:protoheme IX farnesyltransferase